MRELRVLTYNLQKSPAVYNTLISLPFLSAQIDILLLQEPPRSLPVGDLWLALYPSVHNGRALSTCARSVILIRRELDPSMYHQLDIPDTRDVTAVDLDGPHGCLRLINVYRPPNDPVVCLPSLSLLSPPGERVHVLVSGDINAQHPLWAPDREVRSRRAGEAFADLALDAGLLPLLPLNTLTRPARLSDNPQQQQNGTCIDVVFGSPSLEAAVIRCDVAPAKFDANSDHLPLLTHLTFPTRLRPPSFRRNLAKLDVATLLATYEANAHPPASLASAEELDDAVDALTCELQGAIAKAAPLKRQWSRVLPWYTPELHALSRAARRAHRFAQDHPEDGAARQRAKNAVQRRKSAQCLAQRTWTEAQLAAVTEQTLWSEVRRARSTNAPTLPPLRRSDGSVASTLGDKAALLKAALLPSSAPPAADGAAPRDAAPPTLTRFIASPSSSLASTPSPRPRRTRPPRAASDGGSPTMRTPEPGSEHALEQVSWDGEEDAADRSSSGEPETRRGEAGAQESRESGGWSAADVQGARGGRTGRSTGGVTEDASQQEQETEGREGETSAVEEADEEETVQPAPSSLGSRLEEEHSRRNSEGANNHKIKNKNKISTPKGGAPTLDDTHASCCTPPVQSPLPSTSSTPTLFNSPPLNPHAWPFTPTDIPPGSPFHLTDAAITDTLFRLRPSRAGGPSAIPIAVLRALWPAVSERVGALFRAAVRLGHHPRQWRAYLGVVLRKPGKPDYTTPKAYRLIALLETLAKVLEGTMEAAMRRVAEEKSMLPASQFGGRKGRSCEDAVMWVVDEVKEKWRRGQYVVALSLDAKAAFPSVRVPALLDILRKEASLRPALPWLESFLTRRTCRLIVDGTESSEMEGDCGLPQGSPLSPLLYTLYNAALVEAAHSSSSSGAAYVDDLLILGWGRTVEAATAAVQGRVKAVEEWGRAHGTSFEPSKSVVVVMSMRKVAPGGAKVVVEGEEVPSASALKFLGCILDARLTFKPFVEDRVTSAKKALGGVVALSSTTKGVSFKVARRLILACVYPRLDYLSTLWSLAPGAVGARAAFDRVQRACCQFVSGALRSTSLAALEVSAFLMPTVLRLGRVAHRSAVRQRSLPAAHPLHPLVQPTRACPTTHKSPVDHLHAEYPELRSLTVETIDPLADSRPWETHLDVETTIAATKELALDAHDRLVAAVPRSALLFYSDGSLMEERAGAGLAVRTAAEATRAAEGDRRVEEGGGETETEGPLWVWGKKARALGQRQTVYVAELAGVQMGLETLLDMAASARFASVREVHVFLDNTAAVRNAFRPAATSGQALRRRNLNLLLRLRDEHPQIKVHVQWVPGHVGAEGNELADEAAKAGAAVDLQDEGDEGQQELEEADASVVDTEWGASLPKATSALHAEYHAFNSALWDQTWRLPKTTGAALRRLDRHPPSPHILRLHDSLPRALSSLLTQLRTGHSHLAADRYRRLPSSSDRCECGEAETLAHFVLDCPLHRGPRRVLVDALGPLAHNLPFLFTAREAIAHTLRFVVATGRFPRYHVAEARLAEVGAATSGEEGARAGGSRGGARGRKGKAKTKAGVAQVRSKGAQKAARRR